MQLGGFVGAVLALAATLAVAGWWLGGLAVRGLVRLFGDGWRDPDPARFRRRLRLFRAAALLAAALLGLGAWWAVPALAPALAAAADGQDWAGWAIRLGRWLLAAAVAGVALAAAAGVLRAAHGAAGAFRRRRILLGLVAADPDPLPPPAAPEGGGAGGRWIVICCDGTGNRPDATEAGQPATTNVWKLHAALVQDEAQVSWYDPGVATGTSSTAGEVAWSRGVLEALGATAGGQLLAGAGRLARLAEAATGSGLTENIAQGYAEIVRQYRPGDRIHLIGFSRGAYTARCIAGVIERCGLLRAEQLRFAPDVVHLYRARRDPADRVTLPAAMVHPAGAVRVEFLGLFDTVGALGAPLWGWWFRLLPHWRHRTLATDPVAACRHVHHALAMDERRSQFFPTPFSAPPVGGDTVLHQAWFRGNHGDVGGGYAETGLSDIALGWMAVAAARHGLRFRDGAFDGLAPDPMARRHDELNRRPSWRLFGSWPRWHPVPDGTPGAGAPPATLHPSVLERRDATERMLGRPDLLRPGPGGVEVEVQAQRDWDRTGIVLDPGWYRLTHLGLSWRDGEGPARGPDGWDGRGLGAWRTVFGWRRRLPGQPWLRLCAHVAHPRDWPPRELGLAALLRCLYWRDPEALTRQVAPVGRDLRRPGDAAWLHNGAGSGLLHLFANDLWFTAGDNAGAVRLRVERAEGPPPGAARWRLRADGGWEREEGSARPRP